LSRQAYQDPRDMFNSIDGHQTTHNSKSCVVGGDVPHTLAFIVSSVFKVLHTTSTQTLQNEANSASNTRRYRTASQPSVHFPASRWLVVSAGRSRCVRDPRAGRMTNLYWTDPAGNPPWTNSWSPGVSHPSRRAVTQR